MASFQKRGKTWEYRVSRMINGTQKPIRKGGFRTKKEAEVAATELEANLRKGVIPHLKPEPFDEYFRGWVADYKVDISTITLKRYQATLETIIFHFGNSPIQNITKRQYQQFLNVYGLTHAKETTRKLNTHIRACIRTAIEENIIYKDFTKDVVLTGTAKKRNEDKHLNYVESTLFLNKLFQITKDRNLRTITHYILLLGLTSGMRFGEMMGLTREDFDFTKNEIDVYETWDYKGGNGFIPTKNEQSIRIIKMDNKTMSAFQVLFNETPNNEIGLIFYSEISKYKCITNEYVNKLLRGMLKSLDIELISVHGLRHTHASILLYRKVSIYYVSERLGHKDIDTTLKYYAHIIKNYVYVMKRVQSLPSRK
ncbi:tyrosine-type recombinase/integrase [Sporosarcina sp. resist]|uniref:tyrosine-type recombinase/integrase n=1 Tax=Sporosarcina sp. resist TaxID=2762563 RepID=UPI00351C75D0